MSKIKGDINREMLGYAEKHTGDCYGDGTVYRGERSKDSAVRTYTVQELADSKGVSEPVRGALLGMQEKLAHYIKIHDAIVTDADKAYELLRWAETEMRYAGWSTRLNDQHGRTDIYEAIVEFLK